MANFRKVTPRFIVLPVLAVAVLGYAAVAQQGGGQERGDGQRGGGGGRPTEAMLAACGSLSEGATCSAENADGTSVAGVCMAPQGRPLACVPEGGPDGSRSARSGTGQGGGGLSGGQSNSGSKVPTTQAYTLGVLCSHSVTGQNTQLDFPALAQWSCANGQRLLTANSIPMHPVGQFPSNGNPNTISPQTVSYAVTTSPIALSGPGGRVKEPVMGLNGVKFDPGTAGRCDSSITDSRDCDLGRGTGQWSIEALGQDVFDFGDDENHAHVQPSGHYHYHGIPEGMLSAEQKAGQSMALIGWAADGFPVYARFGYANPSIMTSGLAPMKTSYQLKQTPDAGRPDVSIVPMGAFTQDWEYVAGLGDLDECNGRFAVTPEFPEGIYHYYATDGYPYVQRCVKGSVDSQASRPEPRGGGQRGGSGRRGGGQGGGGDRRGQGGGGR